MHTSSRLAATDFSYWRLQDGKHQPITFSEFCVGYHELDRIGVVSPALAGGVLYTGRTLLALTTAFYDCHRARSRKFFDYPQHFAFVAAASSGMESDKSELWAAWGWLDVWPENKWVTVEPTATSMLQSVFDYQINRLFWPRELWPNGDELQLPDYAFDMLHTRLKAVYLYGPAESLDVAAPLLAVSGSVAAEELRQESIARLPAWVRLDNCHKVSQMDYLQPVTADRFIRSMQGHKTAERIIV